MLQNNNKSQTLIDKRCNRYLVVSSVHPALIFFFVTKSFAGGRRGEEKEGRMGRKKEGGRCRRGDGIDRD